MTDDQLIHSQNAEDVTATVVDLDMVWAAVLGLPVWWLLRRYAFRESRQPGV